MGEIHITVDAEKAPITAKNFTDYVEEGFFDGTIFHRVIPNFMIQGGGMTEDMHQKTTKANIENEAKNGLKNVKYSVAMARTMAPHSASSQFFINTNDNQFCPQHLDQQQPRRIRNNPNHLDQESLKIDYH